MESTPRGKAWKATSSSERRKLCHKESDWNLPGSATPTTRTRHGGNGRPHLARKDLFDASSSDHDDQTDNEEEEEDVSEEEANLIAPDNNKKPPASRVTLEVDSLTKMMEELGVCQDCNGPVEVTLKTTCLATSVKAICKDPGCAYILHSNPPAPTTVHDSNNDNYERSTDYAINVLYVLGMMCNGDGSPEAAKLLGLLGLPNDTTMEGRSFHIIEERIGPIIRGLANEIMLENLTEEVRLSVSYEADFLAWKQSIDKTGPPIHPDRYPRITASNDTAWQQKGSGKSHNSPSGHSVIFGHHVRKPLVYRVTSKRCNLCDSYFRKHTEATPQDVPPHDCCHNHNGSSGQMEPDCCLEEAVALYDDFQCVVHRLCCDDDSSVRADCRWSNEVWLANQPPGTKLPLVKKKVGVNKGQLQERPDKGKLPEHVPEPTFVADPNHRRKQLTGDLIALDTKTVAMRHTMTRMDSTRIGKNFGYMARNLRNLSPDQCVDSAKAVLEHHFDCHEYCGPWCRRKDETDEQKQAGQRFYRNKEKDGKLYALLQNIVGNYTSLERLTEIAHGMDTNCCEAFNNLMTWHAPKNKVYCGSRSLWNRVCLCIGVASVGVLPYFTRLFKKLGIRMTPNVLNYLEVKHRSKVTRLEKLKQQATKKKRNKRKYDRLVEYTKLARKERAKRDGYRTGMNLDDEVVVSGGTQQQPRAARAPRNVGVCLHPFCGKRGHKTTRSKHCLANPDRLKRDGLEAACLAAVAAVDEADDAAMLVDNIESNPADNDAADDLEAYESQPFEEFEDDLFYQTGTWEEDEDGNLVPRSAATGII